MDIINPATNKVITSLKSDTKDSVNVKIQELKSGQSKWAKTTLTHRLECIKSFRDDLLQNIDKYANDLTQEVGKPVFESVNEINAACERIDFFLIT